MRRGRIQGPQLGKNRVSNSEKRIRRVGREKQESEMLVGPAEGGPPCWMLVGDVGWVLVVGWLVAVVFFSMKRSKKRRVHTSRFRSSLSLSLSLPHSSEQTDASF